MHTLPGISTHPLAKITKKCSPGISALSHHLLRKDTRKTCFYCHLIDLFIMYVCFPNSYHLMFSRKFSFCLFINYAYKCMWMHKHKTTFERNISLGYYHVVWNGKTKHTCLTAPLITLSVNCINGTKVRLVTNWRTLRRNPLENWVILIFRGQKPCTRII